MTSTHQVEFTLRNRPSEIARLQDQLERFAASHSLSSRALHEVQLALEEHLSNIVKYAHTDDAEHEIKVTLALGVAELRIEVEDDGRPFDPVQYPTPDLSQPIEERPVGGLGIHMMRQSLDGLEYRRAQGRNLLTMIKRI